MTADSADGKAMPGACRTCGTGVSVKHNKSGLCRSCSRSDPEVRARKAETMRLKYRADPEYRARQKAGVTEHNQTPRMRELAGKKAKELKIWEKGLAAMTPELRKQSGRTLSKQKLAHIPSECREDYRVLVRAKVPKEEATAIVLAAYEERLAAFRRKILSER